MNIIVGICASPTSDQALTLIQELLQRGNIVRVVISPSAAEYVRPSMLQALTDSSVVMDIFEQERQYGNSWHTKLVDWCDVMIIAPCSASTLARLAHGNCDTALATVAHATLGNNKRLIAAYVLDSTLRLSPGVQRNLIQVANDGVLLIQPHQIGTSDIVRLPDVKILVEAVLNTTTAKRQHSENQQEPATDQQMIDQQNTDQQLHDEIRRAIETPLGGLQDGAESDRISAELDLIELKKTQ